MTVRVLALTKYGSSAASTRQRFMQYQPDLADAGISVDYSPLLDNAHMQRLAQGRSASPVAVAGSYLRRVASLVRARDHDLLWVHCEYFPYLPGFVEGAAIAIAGKPFVFDYDDAIFHMYDEAPSAIVRTALAGKLEPLLKRAKACLCGNDYLRDYAARFNDRAIVLPTVVDTEAYRPSAARPSGQVTIGWIGSPTTWRYVRPMLGVLEQVCRAHQLRFLAVGAGWAAERDCFRGMELREWSEAREVADVQEMDIGIMPLPDEPWARGKSGYKLIQYMGCGLPVVASPVGANVSIVEDGVHGYLAADAGEWTMALERLVGDRQLREQLGAAGRQKVVGCYSLESQSPRLIDVLKSAAAKG